MRLINADALIMKHCATECGCTREECGLEYNKDGCDGCTFVIEIENEETVEAEPVRHEMWLKSLNGNPFCSGCSTEFKFTDGVPKRCPECGARMDKKRKE